MENSKEVILTNFIGYMKLKSHLHGLKKVKKAMKKDLDLVK